MKSIKITMLMSLMFISLFSFSQKVEKLFYEGFLKNEPKDYLPDVSYTVKYATSDWFKTQMKEQSINLELKGFSEGKDFKIIFISDDPFLEEDILKEKAIGSNTYTYKGFVKAKSNHKIIILNENNDLTYELKIEPKLFHAESSGLGSKDTEAEARSQNTEIKKKQGNSLKKAFVKELLSNYQKALDDHFGKFYKTVDYKIYKITPKKFDYADINDAAEKFKNATSSKNINKEDISYAIEVWEKSLLEYNPGKKTRICDLNIDALYLNLTQAYLAKEDYKNAKSNWDKCESIKGNKGIEMKVNEFLAQQLDNFANYPISKKDFTPKALIDKNTIQNRNLFFNLILSFQFAEILGEMRVIQDYFPLNVINIKEVNSIHYINEYVQEKLLIKYNYKGAPVSTNYQLIDENKIIKSYNLDYNYDNDQLVSVNLNGNLKYNIIYNGDLISEITYNPGKSKSNIYTFDYSDPDKIKIKLKYTIDGVTKESPRNYYVSFNDKGLIRKYLLDVYSGKDHIYDAKGNLVGMSGVNESTGNKYTINYISDFDERGQLIKRKLKESDDYYIERIIKYFY